LWLEPGRRAAWTGLRWFGDPFIAKIAARLVSKSAPFRLVVAACTQEQNGDKLDLDALTQIKHEAFQHSQVMENLFYISEV
jgi:class 3 adenylate cyclase